MNAMLGYISLLLTVIVTVVSVLVRQAVRDVQRWVIRQEQAELRRARYGPRR